MNIFDERYAKDRFPSPKLDPWIFYSHGERNREHTFYSLSEKTVQNKYIKEMIDNDIVCSLHGWLVLSNQIDRRNCQLFNLVSMETVQLPLLPRPRFDSPIPKYDFCVLSSDPNNPNCIVMLIRNGQGMATCYFCRPGDVVWSEKDLELEKIKIFSNYYLDCIYAVGCYKDQICIFTEFEKLLLMNADPPYLTTLDLGVGPIPCYPWQHGNVQTYLVESDGELFVIWKLDLRIDAYDFFVCKLDISEKKNKLVVVENLEGRAFFLSSPSSGITCSTFEKYGIKENTIYFTEPSDPCIYSFDMQKKILTFSLPCLNVRTNLVHAEWILSVSPNAPKVKISSPLQIKKFTMLRPSFGKDWSQLPGVVEKPSRSITGSDWSELPRDVIISIAEKLSCVSCARIASVCKNWRSIITWTPKKLNGCPTFLHMSSSSTEVFHFVNGSRYNLSIPDNPKVLSIEYANHGWLLMTRYGGMKLFFLNPLSSEIIEIPDLPAQVRSFCFTSFPTSSSCNVLVIYEGNSHSFVYHIRRGMVEWTEVKIPEFETIVGDIELTPYSNPLFHKGVFYWICGFGNLCTYDSIEENVKFLNEPRSPCKSMCISYLFENGEKLMSVWVGRYGEWVRVYELDEVSMNWEEVNTLDKKVIFLSRNSCLVTEMHGLDDIICFNRFIDDNQPLMYSLKSGEFGVYGGGHHTIRDFCDIPEYHIKSAWIEPNVKQHSVQELSWYDVGL